MLFVYCPTWFSNHTMLETFYNSTTRFCSSGAVTVYSIGTDEFISGFSMIHVAQCVWRVVSTIVYLLWSFRVVIVLSPYKATPLVSSQFIIVHIFFWGQKWLNDWLYAYVNECWMIECTSASVCNFYDFIFYCLYMYVSICTNVLHCLWVSPGVRCWTCD